MKKYIIQPYYLGCDRTFGAIKSSFVIKQSCEIATLQNEHNFSTNNFNNKGVSKQKELVFNQNDNWLNDGENFLKKPSFVSKPKKRWWQSRFFRLFIILVGLVGLVSLGVGGVIIGGVLEGEPIVEAAKLEPAVVMATGIQSNHLTFADEGLLLYASSTGIKTFNIFNKKEETLIIFSKSMQNELVDLTYDQGTIALAWSQKVDLYNQAGELINSKSQPRMLVSSVHLSGNIMLIVYHPQDVPQKGMLKTEFIFYDLITDKIISRHYIPGSRKVIDVFMNETEAQIIAKNNYQYIPPAAIQVTMPYRIAEEKFYKLTDLKILPGAKEAFFDKNQKLFWLDNAQPSNIKYNQEVQATGKNLLLGRFDRQLFYYQSAINNEFGLPTITLIEDQYRKYDLSIIKDLTLFSVGQIIKTGSHKYLALPAINKQGRIEVVLVLND